MAKLAQAKGAIAGGMGGVTGQLGGMGGMVGMVEVARDEDSPESAPPVAGEKTVFAVPLEARSRMRGIHWDPEDEDALFGSLRHLTVEEVGALAGSSAQQKIAGRRRGPSPSTENTSLSIIPKGYQTPLSAFPETAENNGAGDVVPPAETAPPVPGGGEDAPPPAPAETPAGGESPPVSEQPALEPKCKASRTEVVEAMCLDVGAYTDKQTLSKCRGSIGELIRQQVKGPFPNYQTQIVHLYTARSAVACMGWDHDLTSRHVLQ